MSSNFKIFIRGKKKSLAPSGCPSDNMLTRYQLNTFVGWHGPVKSLDGNTVLREAITGIERISDDMTGSEQ